MIVLVCGGRAYPHEKHVRDVLDGLLQSPTIDRLVFGDAVTKDPGDPSNRRLWTGVDYFAWMWALDKGVPICRHCAEWGKYGKTAGSMRNARMLAEAHPDIVLVFPGGSGTDDMRNRAIREGVKVIVVPGQGVGGT